MIKILATILLVASAALAETPVNIVAVNGPHALSDARIMELWKLVDRSFDRAGSPVRLNKFTRIDEISSSVQLGYDNMVDRLYDYKPLVGNVKTIFIVPPIQQFGKLWLTGVAEVGCSAKVGWAAAMEQNQDGAARFLVSVLAVKHELGHAKGASHTELNPSVMWPDALALLVQGWRLRWLPKSKREMAFCDGAVGSTRGAGLEILPIVK